jgi:ubiquinone/menaquinone biosynthesis C-methylase UbiE
MGSKMLNRVQAITRVTCDTYNANATAYGEVSEDYDRFPGLRAEVVDFASRALRDLPVLDLGCGGGRDSRLLSSLGRRVIAGDYAGVMLEWARSRSVSEGRPSEFLRLDALALPLQDGSIAGVWASGSLLHIPRVQLGQALAEVYRVLAPGGNATISMRSGEDEGWKHGGSLDGERWFTFVSPQTFVRHLYAAGFSDVQIRFSGRPGWFVALGVR